MAKRSKITGAAYGTQSLRERCHMATKPLACWICGKQVDLSKCKVDEHGLPVHEPCYVARMALKPQADGRSSSTLAPKSNSRREGHEPAA